MSLSALVTVCVGTESQAGAHISVRQSGLDLFLCLLTQFSNTRLNRVASAFRRDG